jgi:hypothetical protein
MLPPPVRTNLPSHRDITTWPEQLKPYQQLSGALFEERPALRKLVVLVDAELLAPDSDVTISPHALLTGLLTHSYLEVFHYQDNGPPPSVPRKTYRSGALTAAEGWAELLPRQPNGGRSVIYADTRDAGTAAIYENGVTFARQDNVPFIYADLDPTAAADRRVRDILAAEVSQAIQADLFVTERPYLYATRGVVAQGVTVCRVLEALALIGLYLRSQNEFITWRASDGISTATNEWRYYDIGTRELLPSAWRWSYICTEASKARHDDRLPGLAGSTWHRIQRVLRSRDQFHRVYRLPPNNDTARSLLNELDSILISLMGAVDGAARVVHLLFSFPDEIRNAGWQKSAWRKELSGRVPELAALFADGSNSRHTLNILTTLRNTVHGQMMRFITVQHSVGLRDTFVTLPTESENKVLGSMEPLGGRSVWGVFARVNRQVVDVGVFLEQLLHRVLELLDEIMWITTAAYGEHVLDNASIPASPDGQYGSFSERNRRSICWQLGLSQLMIQKFRGSPLPGSVPTERGAPSGNG